MLIGNNVAKEIYEYLKKDIPNLPIFSFQLGLKENDCLIFTLSDKKPVEYFCNPLICSFHIRLYNPKMSHPSQVKMMDQIIDKLCSKEFKNLLYNNNEYRTNHIYINEFPNPNKNQIIANLESYTDITQCYMIELSLVLERINKDETNK